jgi:hypothetical protein
MNTDNKLIVEEKINKTDKYYEERGVYLELNNGQVFIYKKMFQSLNCYSMIIELYQACIDGLELKPFRTSHINLAWCKKLTSSQSMEFDKNKKFIIDDNNYTHSQGSTFLNVNINQENQTQFFNILSWIKKCLEEFYPELKDGFINILCMSDNSKNNSNKKNPKIFDDNFKKKFKEIYGENYIDDIYRNMKSLTRQDQRVFNLIKDLDLIEPKIYVYQVPKFAIHYSEIKKNIFYDEYIDIDLKSLFYDKFLRLKNDNTYYSESEKMKNYSENFNNLNNFNNLIQCMEYDNLIKYELN